MQVRLISIATIQLAFYLAFGSYFYASMTMSPENLIGDIGKAVGVMVTSVTEAIFD